MSFATFVWVQGYRCILRVELALAQRYSSQLELDEPHWTNIASWCWCCCWCWDVGVVVVGVVVVGVGVVVVVVVVGVVLVLVLLQVS